MSANRVLFAVAAAAERQALARSTEAEPPLTSFEWRVLSAVIALTVSYSKLEDRIYLAQVAAFAFGFGFERLPEPEQETGKKARRDWRIVETGRALRRLRDRGIVIYSPARGRGHPSLIGLPAPVEKGGARAPLSDGEKARAGTPLSDDKRRGIRPLKGAASSPRPTKELPGRNLRAWLDAQKTDDGEPLHPRAVGHALARIDAKSYSYPRKAALKIARDEHPGFAAEQAGRDRHRAETERIAACPGCDQNGWRLDEDGSTLDPAAKCDHAEAGQ